MPQAFSLTNYLHRLMEEAKRQEKRVWISIRLPLNDQKLHPAGYILELHTDFLLLEAGPAPRGVRYDAILAFRAEIQS